MKVVIVGDAHGNWEGVNQQLVLARDRLGAEAGIQVGDFGIARRRLESFARDQRRFALPLYAIDGNHDDHAYLARAFRSGRAAVWAEQLNLHFQPRASIAKLGGRVVGFLGGALHVARPQQHGLFSGAPNYLRNQEVRKAAELFNSERPALIVTHSCPSGIGIGMRGNPALELGLHEHVVQAGFDPGPRSDRGEAPLRLLWDLMVHRPQLWVFGHFHVEWSVQLGQTRFVCLPVIDTEVGSRLAFWDSERGSLEFEHV